MAVAYKLTKYSGITKESNNANDLDMQSEEISKNITGLIDQLSIQLNSTQLSEEW